jgi:hypothetical protein
MTDAGSDDGPPQGRAAPLEIRAARSIVTKDLPVPGSPSMTDSLPRAR